MRDNFKLEDNYNKKNNNKDNLILLIIIFVSFCVIVFVSIYLITRNNVNFISKIDKDKDYVYTIKQEENPYEESKYDKVPIINLNDNKISVINESILDKYMEVTKQIQYDYNYEFSKSKNILSLKITYAYFETEYSEMPVRYFNTYNIDLKTGNILSDDEIYDMYNLDRSKVDMFLQSKFNGFYNDLVNSKFYSEEQCNYDCFLKNRGISSDYLNNVSLYIKDGSLIAYKFFNIKSKYKEERYFKNFDYKFIVKK